MIFKWETEKERLIRGSKISLSRKLEGFRLINELTDKVLTLRQKIVRQKLRESR